MVPRLLASMWEFKIDTRTAALGRLDVATELRFAEGRDGLAFPATSLSDVPWAKVGTEGRSAIESRPSCFDLCAVELC